MSSRARWRCGCASTPICPASGRPRQSRAGPTPAPTSRCCPSRRARGNRWCRRRGSAGSAVAGRRCWPHGPWGSLLAATQFLTRDLIHGCGRESAGYRRRVDVVPVRVGVENRPAHQVVDGVNGGRDAGEVGPGTRASLRSAGGSRSGGVELSVRATYAWFIPPGASVAGREAPLRRGLCFVTRSRAW